MFLFLFSPLTGDESVASREEAVFPRGTQLTVGASQSTLDKRSPTASAVVTISLCHSRPPGFSDGNQILLRGDDPNVCSDPGHGRYSAVQYRTLELRRWRPS